MKPGDILLVRFPFSDLESSKRRPAVALVRSDLTAKVGVVTIAMITSKTDGLKFPGDYRIENWEDAGLLHPSLVRLAKVATIEGNMVDKTIGRLEVSDLKKLQLSFQKHFKAWL
jgi:mRNA interferase MazF